MNNKKKFSSNCFPVANKKRHIFQHCLPLIWVILLLIIIPNTLKRDIKHLFEHVQAGIYTSTVTIEELRKRFENKLLSKSELVGFCEQLIRQNIFLQTQIDTIVAEKQYNHDRYTLGNFITIPAKVLRRDIATWTNELIINIGHNDGIQKNMGVISNGYAIGRIKSTTENTSIVELLTSPTFRIACHALNDIKYHPIIFSGKNTSSLNKARGHAEEIPYEIFNNSNTITLITSSLSGIFPEGIIIGTVKSPYNKGEEYFNETVHLNGNLLSHLYEVSVLIPQ